MKKMILFISFLIILTGCSAPGPGSGSGGTSNFRTGSQGISLNFLEGNPPSTAFHNSDINIILEYKNLGADNLESGTIYLSGFDDSIINVDKAEKPMKSLEGKSLYNPQGGFSKTMEFSAKVKLPNEEIDRIEQTITATACYAYKTVASAEICIDPTIGETGIVDKPCSVHDVSLGGGQGGPIAVTKIEQQMSKSSSGSASKVLFKIYIKNLGNGIPYKDVANCQRDLKLSDIDYVTLGPAGISSDKSLRCKPEGQIHLNNGEGFALCETTADFGTNAFNTQFHITLQYNYRQSISKNIEIINI